MTQHFSAFKQEYFYETISFYNQMVLHYIIFTPKLHFAAMNERVKYYAQNRSENNFIIKASYNAIRWSLLLALAFNFSFSFGFFFLI